MLVIPIWFTGGTVGTTDPTLGPGAIPTVRFDRALQSDPSGNSALRWWREASFGQIHLSGVVTPWLRVPLAAPAPGPGPNDLGSCGRQDYVDAAVAAAANQGYRQADFDQVVVVPAASTCAISGLAGTGKDGVHQRTAATFLHATDSHDTLVFLFAHELLHNLGLIHASATECRVGAFRIADAMDPRARCDHLEYEDHTSVMGRLDEVSTSAHHPSAVEKAEVGWITKEAGDITEVAVSSLTTSWRQIVIRRSNIRGSGPILLRLVHDVDGGARGETSVELRGRVRSAGTPAHTFEPMATVWGGSPASWLNGLSIRSGFDLIDATPGTSSLSDAPLRPEAGTVITSPGGPGDRPWIGAVEIRATSIAGDAAVVSIRRPPSISQPFEAARACFRADDPHPGTVTRLDLGCSVFAPQQRITVDWGDGSARTVVPPPLLTIPQLAHRYPSDAARCYRVTLRIQGGDPLVASTSSRTIVRGRDGHPSCARTPAPTGAAVPVGSAPWVASIRLGTHHSCGGALVAARWVLTSMSCYQRGFALAGLLSVPLDVVLGTTSLGPEDASVEHHALDASTPIVANPRSGLLLLHLAAASAAPPVAVATTSPSIGSQAMVVGWGDIETAFGGWWPRSTRLLRTPMEVRPGAECEGSSVPSTGGSGAGPNDAPAAGVCVGATAPGSTTTCAGDLGGPVVASNPTALVGVVDAARGTGPGGFADRVCGRRVGTIPITPSLGWITQST